MIRNEFSQYNEQNIDPVVYVSIDRAIAFANQVMMKFSLNQQNYIVTAIIMNSKQKNKKVEGGIYSISKLVDEAVFQKFNMKASVDGSANQKYGYDFNYLRVIELSFLLRILV